MKIYQELTVLSVKKCPRCHKLDPFVFERVIFTNGSVHIRKVCKRCTKHISYVKMRDVVGNIKDKHYKIRSKDRIYDSRAKVLEKLGFTDYNEYLFSLLWKKIRKRVLKRDKCRCKLCGKRAECVHHIKYELANLSGRSLKNMVSLCHDCHKDIEFDEKGVRRNLDASIIITKKRIREAQINGNICTECLSNKCKKGKLKCGACVRGNTKKQRVGKKKKKKKRYKKGFKVPKRLSKIKCADCGIEFTYKPNNDDKKCNICYNKNG